MMLSSKNIPFHASAISHFAGVIYNQGIKCDSLHFPLYLNVQHEHVSVMGVKLDLGQKLLALKDDFVTVDLDSKTI